MSQTVRINDRITWVVADPGQTRTGKGITPDNPIIPTKTEFWILCITFVLWDVTAKIIRLIKFPFNKLTKLVIAGLKEFSELFYKRESDKPIRFNWEGVGEVLTIIGACLGPILVFVGSVAEVLLASMAESICF